MPPSVPYREFLPFKKAESVMIYHHVGSALQVPEHYHSEFEITLLLNGKGIERNMDGHVHILSDAELLMVGNGLSHGWYVPLATTAKTTQISLYLTKKSLSRLKITKRKKILDMLQESVRAVEFSQTTAMTFLEKLGGLQKATNKKSGAAVADILRLMANESYQKLLPAVTIAANPQFDILSKYLKKHYAEKITLGNISEFMNMSQPTLNRFIKKHTGQTFVNYLNHVRVAYASRMLAETDTPIAAVAAAAGFNNIANFNRIFKKLKNQTPLQYREKLYGSIRFF